MLFSQKQKQNKKTKRTKCWFWKWNSHWERVEEFSQYTSICPVERLSLFWIFLNCLQFLPTTKPMNRTELLPLAVTQRVILVNNAKLPTLMGQLFLVFLPQNSMLFRSRLCFSELWVSVPCVWNTPFLLWPLRIRCHHFRNPKKAILYCISCHWFVCVASIQLWILGTTSLSLSTKSLKRNDIRHKGHAIGA